MNISKLLKSLNTSGIPIPTAMDPLTGRGSVTFMLVCLSGLFVMLAICNVKNIDKTMAEDWFLYCLGGYLGRTVIKHGKDVLNKRKSNANAEGSNSSEENSDSSEEQLQRDQKTPDSSK